MVEHQLPKLRSGVRFPSPAPYQNGVSACFTRRIRRFLRCIFLACHIRVIPESAVMLIPNTGDLQLVKKAATGAEKTHSTFFAPFDLVPAAAYFATCAAQFYEIDVSALILRHNAAVSTKALIIRRNAKPADFVESCRFDLTFS